MRWFWGWLGVCVVICVGWHIVLAFTPTDGLTGAGTFQNDQYQLQLFAPPDSQWADSGDTVYRSILRVDAKNINEWLGHPLENLEAWNVGTSHQYLVERRDGDGKRVINTRLQFPHFLTYLGADVVAVLVTLLVVIAIGVMCPVLSGLSALILMTSGLLLMLAWTTFALPFSYIALGWPIWGQLLLHMIGGTLFFGSLAHVAFTFDTTLAWYNRHQRAILMVLYGLYPAGLLLLFITQPTLTSRLTSMQDWQQQASIILRAVAYLVWAAQYRRSTLSRRGQLHWILIGLAAYDLPYLVSTLTETPFGFQSWLGLLPPLGYLIAVIPNGYLRFRLTATSGVIHGLATVLMTTLFLSGFGLAANFLLTNGQANLLPFGTILLAILFSIATVPLMDLLREQLDRWFNGTRGRHRTLLHEFTGRVSDQIALDQVTSAFKEILEQGVQPEFASLWLWESDLQILQSPNFSKNAPVAIPFDQPERLLALTSFTPNGQLQFWPEGIHYHGAIALVLSGTLIGVCAIGPRMDGGAYSGDALHFLETLIRATTLAFRNAQLVSQLEDKIRALRKAYLQLITVQETERRNLAADLHDETLQQLAHANLMTATVQMSVDKSVQPTVTELQEIITLTERRLREILKGIHPSVLTDLGLEAAIRSWLPRTHEVIITFVGPDFVGKRLPNPELEMTLYRLTQESVNNALKHAKATRIEIRLAWRADSVLLEVSDNGVGFLPASQLTGFRQIEGEGHFGLLNLRERVQALGGKLRIESQIGQGTRLYAELPVKGISDG